MAGKDDTMDGRTGTRLYETATGILVPIPPISGGSGDDVGAPAAPAAPAAPSVDSAPSPAAPAAPAPVSPAPEVAGIRSTIDAIFSDPQLGPLAPSRVAPTPGPPGAAPAAPVGDKLRKAFEDYQRAPDDQTAFAHLINTAVELGEQRTLSTLEGRAIDRANATRGHQMRVAIAQTVNDAVAKEAPDVDLEIFWSYSQRAQAETPRHLTNRSERIEWQTTRAIELARAKLAQIRGAAASAGVVTPGRAGTPPPATPGATGGPKSMIEVIREMRRRQFPG